MNNYSGKLTVNDQYCIGIVVSDFNQKVINALLNGAIYMLKKLNVNVDNINIYHVPGAFEIPFIVKKLLDQNKFDGILTLGAVIKGETDHYKFICENVSNAIMNLNVNSSVPIVFGVLTTNDINQAMQRSGLKMGNNGSNVAQSLIEMISLNKQI